MLKGVLTSALLCAALPAHAIDERCFGGGRYQAMAEADHSGHGTGHACDENHQGEPRLPAGVSCEDVRARVAEHGRSRARAWATLRGYSRAQIREAEKCL